MVIVAGCGNVTPFEDDTDIEVDTGGDIEVDTGGETNDTIQDTIQDESETIPDVYETEAPETSEDTTGDTTEDSPDVEIEAPCIVCYRDFDMDGFGRDDDTACMETCHGSYVAIGGDCCDGDGEVHPGQEGWFAGPYTCPGESWDYNCNGAEDYIYPATEPYSFSCPYFNGTSEEECESHGFFSDGTPAECGEWEPGMYCNWVDGAYCTTGSYPIQYCH